MIIRNLGIALLSKQTLLREMEEGVEAGMRQISRAFSEDLSFQLSNQPYKQSQEIKPYSFHRFHCHHCGKDFKRTFVSGFNVGNIKYCSPECTREAKLKKRFGKY